jgi:DNA polymerase III delta prime subunit
MGYLLVGEPGARLGFLKNEIDKREGLTTELRTVADLNNYAAKLNLLVVSKPEDRVQIGVEAIAELIEFSGVKPHLSIYSYAIIDMAELLNTQAQNKLLKLLEEPGEHLQIFLLASKRHKLLPTIVSRCLVYQLHGDTTVVAANDSLAEIVQTLATGDVTSQWNSYQQLDKQIAAAKSSPEKREVFSAVAEELAKLAQQSLTRGELPLAEKLAKAGQDLYRQSQASVNAKLIIDKLFVSLASDGEINRVRRDQHL